MNKKRDASSRERSARDADIRGLRIEELFREELNSILDSEIQDPRLDGIRVTAVELSRDGSRARIWFALASEGEPTRVRNVEAAFERASGFLRSRLCETLVLKRMPELRFRHDPTALLAPGRSTEPMRFSSLGRPRKARVSQVRAQARPRARDEDRRNRDGGSSYQRTTIKCTSRARCSFCSMPRSASST